MQLRLLLVPAAILLGACAAVPQPELTDAEKATITSAVEGRIQEYIEAAKRGDVEWFDAFWAKDGFAMAGDGDLVVSQEAYLQQLRGSFAELQQMLEFEVSDPHTVVLGRDAASHALRFRWAYTTTGGDTLRAHGSWVYVFRQSDGAWQAVQSGGMHVME